jgi:hypothetical protein
VRKQAEDWYLSQLQKLLRTELPSENPDFLDQTKLSDEVKNLMSLPNLRNLSVSWNKSALDLLIKKDSDGHNLIFKGWGDKKEDIYMTMTSKCHLDCRIYKITTEFTPLFLAQIPKLKQLPTINSQTKTNIFFQKKSHPNTYCKYGIRQAGKESIFSEVNILHFKLSTPGPIN